MDVHESALIQQDDRFLPGVGLLVARDELFALAVKAGNNGESHNHNDVGSVTIYKDGQPVLIDVGVETYTAKTFSPRRYEIWTMQSSWHNLPTFDGVMQHDGAEFAARDVRTVLADDRAEMSMDIAGAYAADAKVRSYRRRVTLNKGRNIEIDDEFDGDRPAELSLMFASRPTLGASSIALAGLATILLEGAGVTRLEEIPITDARLHKAWPDRLYRVLVPLAGSRLKLTIT
jgi:hypothetical protein